MTPRTAKFRPPGVPLGAMICAVALGLAGCSAFDQMFGKPKPEAPGPEEHLPMPPPPAPKPPVVHSTAPPPAVVIDGLTASEARDMLGEPATQAASGPGQTWTYRAGHCQLSLFLFPDVDSGGLRVLDHHIDGAGPRDTDQQTCLRQLQHNHGN